MKANRDGLLLVATAAVWIIAYAAWTADWMIGPSPHVLERALRRVPVCLFGAATCWGIGRLLDRTTAWRTGARLGSAFALCIVAALVYDAANTLACYVIAPVWGHATFWDRIQNAMMIVWVFFAWVALYFAIDASAEAGRARLRLADAETAAMRARTQALAQQIGPHFLFNALNTVCGLIAEGDAARAERVTVALASLLRRSLEADRRESVPLGEELDAVHRYLDIEQSRFEDRLRVVERVAPELRGLAVPPLILQPLVENAMRHGVARSAAPVEVAIEAEAVGGVLRLAVSDDAVTADGAAPATGQGIGQANVRERLALLHGARGSLACGANPASGYRCEIRLPAVRHADA